jgi:hypothetical protein
VSKETYYRGKRVSKETYYTYCIIIYIPGIGGNGVYIMMYIYMYVCTYIVIYIYMYVCTYLIIYIHI